MSAATMLAWVCFAHGAIYGDEEIGGGPIAAFNWHFEPAFDARREIDGLDASARAAWMRGEIQVEAEDEMERGWATMAEEVIQEPSILVIVDGNAYCWDGNHRIGSRCIGTNPFLPAIIGTPKVALPESLPSERNAA